MLVTTIHGAWPGLPLATAVVNLVGCAGFGLCWGLAQERWSPVVATSVLAGFFGAFTTFSSFAFDCHELLVTRRFAWLAANVLGQNLLGLAALAAGIAAARMVRA